MLLTASGVHASTNEGEQLLKSMQSAVHSLSYAGKLVFWKGNEMSEYHIEHQSGQDDSSETVIQLDTANDPASGQMEQFSLVNSSSLQLPAQQVYSIDMGQDAVIAGLPCKVVVIRPKDKMRYLYRYCIHPDSGMLLKYSVMNRQQQLLEQFMFTQLSISPGADQERPEVQSASMAVAESVTPVAITNSETVAGHWDLSQLPAGFKVQQVRMIPGKDNAHQVILSDGLTFVSVFIEPDRVDSADMQRQAHASGATNILTVKMAGHAITMVGEVPNETLQAIKKGLRYVAP
ncbi:MAG: MucB/RseB C-terminal domain-containing protein [Thiolinea sp.]